MDWAQAINCRSLKDGKKTIYINIPDSWSRALNYSVYEVLVHRKIRERDKVSVAN